MAIAWKLPPSDRLPLERPLLGRRPYSHEWRDYMRGEPRQATGRAEKTAFDRSEIGAAFCGEDPPGPPLPLSDDDLLETGLSDVVPSK